ncbi:hypothetical protein CEXT_585201 [Caerostris extrusa]|uniref:Uncharacterized protein n=1 Tax=Caerostris extrusa TaxID=172846 RepID=A0AAV4QMC2_CAEEX|nr:hypothetical protein CEXT_585201 [Caerostris extrusa]
MSTWTFSPRLSGERNKEKKLGNFSRKKKGTILRMTYKTGFGNPFRGWGGGCSTSYHFECFESRGSDPSREGFVQRRWKRERSEVIDTGLQCILNFTF